MAEQFVSRWGDSHLDDFGYFSAPGWIMRHKRRFVNVGPAAIKEKDEKGKSNIIGWEAPTEGVGQVVGVSSNEWDFISNLMSFRYDSALSKGAMLSMDKIAQRMGITVQAVHVIKRKMVDKGLLTIIPQHNPNGSSAPNIYDFSELVRQCQWWEYLRIHNQLSEWELDDWMDTEHIQQWVEKAIVESGVYHVLEMRTAILCDGEGKNIYRGEGKQKFTHRIISSRFNLRESNDSLAGSGNQQDLTTGAENPIEDMLPPDLNPRGNNMPMPMLNGNGVSDGHTIVMFPKLIDNADAEPNGNNKKVKKPPKPKPKSKQQNAEPPKPRTWAQQWIDEMFRVFGIPEDWSDADAAGKTSKFASQIRKQADKLMESDETIKIEPSIIAETYDWLIHVKKFPQATGPAAIKEWWKFYLKEKLDKQRKTEQIEQDIASVTIDDPFSIE